MTDRAEAVSLVEGSPSAPSGSPGLLEAIHQRWLERTEGGNDKVIAAGLRKQAQSDDPDEELCIDLVDGYIVQIGRRHVTGNTGESEAYLTGMRAVQSYLATTIPETPKKVTLWNVLGAIEEAFEADPSEAGQPVSTPAPRTPIKIIRPSRKNEKPAPPRPENWRSEAREKANDKRIELAKVRAGLREGTISLSEALEHPSVERAAIADILIRIPSVGKVKRRAALKAVEVAGETEVGTLEDAQKTRLISIFPPERYRPKRRQRGTANLDQSMEALKRANEVRVHRAGLKKKLATGEITVEELFEDAIGSGMELGEVIIKLPTRRTGTSPENIHSRQLMEVVLAETELSSSKLLNQLTERQRRILLSRLAARYKEETGTYTYSKR